MNYPSSPTVGAVGLVDWLKRPAPRYSLALGANCGCDISRLGQDICDALNGPGLPGGGRYLAFNPDEIRMLAGDPYWRDSIHAAASRRGVDIDSRCDYECVVRGVAAHGGAILSGQTALEATADLDNIFRVALSHCDRCCPDAALKLDPDGFSHDGLAAIIAKRFVRWCQEQVTPRHPRTPAGALETVFA